MRACARTARRVCPLLAASVLLLLGCAHAGQAGCHPAAPGERGARSVAHPGVWLQRPVSPPRAGTALRRHSLNIGQSTDELYTEISVACPARCDAMERKP